MKHISKIMLDRATCEHFISRSLKGIARPCNTCPHATYRPDPHTWGYIKTCPKGHYFIPPEELP